MDQGTQLNHEILEGQHKHIFIVGPSSYESVVVNYDVLRNVIDMHCN